MHEYAERDAILSAMGYHSYKEYLSSKLWQRIRKQVMLAHEDQCIICQRTANHVHHADYSRDVMEGHCIDSLVAVCATCHELAEFDEQGNKTTLAQANARLGLFRKLGHRRPRHRIEKARKPETTGSDHCICGNAKQRKSEKCNICSRGKPVEPQPIQDFNLSRLARERTGKPASEFCACGNQKNRKKPVCKACRRIGKGAK